MTAEKKEVYKRVDKVHHHVDGLGNTYDDVKVTITYPGEKGGQKRDDH